MELNGGKYLVLLGLKGQKLYCFKLIIFRVCSDRCLFPTVKWGFYIFKLVQIWALTYLHERLNQTTCQAAGSGAAGGEESAFVSEMWQGAGWVQLALIMEQKTHRARHLRVNKFY